MPTIRTYIIDVVEDESGASATFSHEDERSRAGIFAGGASTEAALNNLITGLRVIDGDVISVGSLSDPEPEPRDVAVPAGDSVEAFRRAAETDTEFRFLYRSGQGTITQRRVRVLGTSSDRRQLRAVDLDKDEPRTFTLSGISDVVKVA